jgi:spore coat protein U-like protein
MKMPNDDLRKGHSMNFKTKVASVFGAGIMAFGMAAGVAAQTYDNPPQVPVDVVVGAPSDAGINYTITQTSSFNNVVSNLNEAQPATGTFAVTVTDNRFTLRGWSFSISADDFRGDNVANTTTIPIGNFSADSGEVTAISVNAGDLPVASDLVMRKTPQVLFAAAPGTGSGRYQVTVTGKVMIPANTPADTYSTTIKIDMNAAP